MEYLFIGAGGVLGAIARFAFGKMITRKYNKSFPLGTFIINISGAFILGLLINISTKDIPSLPYLKMMLTTGFLGAYTTFSTFTYETITLIKQGEYWQAAKYVLLSYLFGISLCFIAYFLSEQ